MPWGEFTTPTTASLPRELSISTLSCPSISIAGRPKADLRPVNPTAGCTSLVVATEALRPCGRWLCCIQRFVQRGHQPVSAALVELHVDRRPAAGGKDASDSVGRRNRHVAPVKRMPGLAHAQCCDDGIVPAAVTDYQQLACGQVVG